MRKNKVRRLESGRLDRNGEREREREGKRETTELLSSSITELGFQSCSEICEL